MEQAGFPKFGTVLDNPDLAVVATSLGLTGIRIKQPDELRPGLARAFGTVGPVLVDVVTNPTRSLYLSHPTSGDAWGFAIAKIKEVVRSRADR